MILLIIIVVIGIAMIIGSIDSASKKESVVGGAFNGCAVLFLIVIGLFIGLYLLSKLLL